MVRSSLIYSSLTMVSRVLGLARDLVLSNVMGASATIAADAYNTAFAFPNLFRRIFAEGAFATAFVPAYARALVQDGEETADELATDAMATLLFATLVLTFVCELAMPWLMYLIAPGFASDPEKFRLAIVLTQIMMPYLPLMAIFAHLSGVLQARGKFIATAAAFSLLNLCTPGDRRPHPRGRPRLLCGELRGGAGGGGPVRPRLVGPASLGRAHPLPAPAPDAGDQGAPEAGRSRNAGGQRHPDQPLRLRHPRQPGAGRPHVAGLCGTGSTGSPCPWWAWPLAWRSCPNSPAPCIPAARTKPRPPWTRRWCCPSPSACPAPWR